MRIAFVGDFTRNWNTEQHLALALEELGHNVDRISERNVDWRRLASRMRQVQLFLWVHSAPGPAGEQMRTLAALEEIGVTTASFHLDRYWGLGRGSMVRTDPFFRTQLVVTADGGSAEQWQEAGVRHEWMPPGVHGPEIGRGAARATWASDVAFVGSIPYPHPEWAAERSAVVKYLADRYATRFQIWPKDRRDPVRGTDLNDLYASVKVIVGDSCIAGGHTRYWSDRVPETLGRGGFLVHPRVEGLEDWYEDGEHLALYDAGDLDQLGVVVDKWLEDHTGRERVISQALELVRSRDTYRHRAVELLRLVEGFNPVRKGWVDGAAGLTVVHQGDADARFNLRPESSDGLVVREVWQQGMYRLTEQQVRHGTVVDVGANVGAFTILAAKLGARRVIALEPVASNRSAMNANLALNGYTDIVDLLGCAACDYADEVAMVEDGSGSHIDPDSAGGGVESRPLADVLRDVEEIAFLKVDMEGGEFLSLRSFAEVLPRVRKMAMEWHSPGMPHLRHLKIEQFGELCVVLAEHGTMEVVGRPSTGGMIYWKRHG